MTKHPTTSSDRVLQTARGLFFAHGFEAVTTDLLAREASVSKATIYRTAPSMAELFMMVMEREVERFEGEVMADFEGREGLRDCLMYYGVRLLTFLNEPDTLGFSRIMAERARQHPKTARRFVEAAYERSLDGLEPIIAEAQRKGLLTPNSPPRAIAEAFAGALEGFGLVRAHHGIDGPPYSEPERAARLAADMVVDGLGMGRG